MASLGAVSLGYAFCIALLALGGARPGTPPWLSISPETYFRWEAAFIAPVILFGGILAAGTMHISAVAAGGRGSFDDALAAIGGSIAISTLATLIPDTLVGALLVLDIVDPDAWMRAVTRPSGVLALVWVYLLLYLAAFLAFFPAVARVCYGLGRGTAFAVGAGTFLVYQLFLYVFVR
jgi:hypothetical protein